MYKVDISHAANEVLQEYTFRCARDNGEDGALRLLDSYDEKMLLWFVFQIKENENCVKIEYIIDDRQNYGNFLR